LKESRLTVVLLINYRNYTFFIIVFTLAFIGWTWKSMHFAQVLVNVQHTKGLLVSSFGLMLIVISPLFFKISKWTYACSFTLYTLISFLLYADVIYQRYYHSLLSVQLIKQATQLNEVNDSVISLIKETDILYFADVLLLIVLFFYPLVKGAALHRARFGITLGVALIGFLIMKSTYAFLVEPNFTQQYKASRVGIIGVHAGETYQFYAQQAKAAEVFNNQDNVDQLQNIEEELKKRQEMQKNSPYFGDAKGNNLIMIQAESLNDYVVNLVVNNQEITPHLNDFIKKSSYYPNIYLQIGKGNTSDAEFVANNSLYPSENEGAYFAYEKKELQSLAQIFKKEGYQTSAVHGNDPNFWNRSIAYPAQGYDEFYSIEHPEIDSSDQIGLGISDRSMFQQMIPIWKEQSKKGPFYSFFITLSNHRPFKLTENEQLLNLPPTLKNTKVGDYLQNVRYADEAFGELIEGLKREELYENTVIAFYGDHYGLLQSESDVMIKTINVRNTQKEMFNIPLVIHRPTQTEGEVNKIIGSQMDIAPTLTSLFGIEQPLYQLGIDLSVKKEGYVGFRHETTPFTFFSKEYDFRMSPDGNFENGICASTSTGKKVEVQQCKKYYDRVRHEVEISDFLLRNNAIGRLLKEND
jgi:lipoteichoic acid synthase